ncbi:MAG TPA: nuclear transport factor 2 family protein [Acidimicrobiia bacterium]
MSATTDLSTDETAVLELHRRFVAANQAIDVGWLRANLAPGPDALVWFNLNKSDYIGVDHICRLWEFLAAVAGGAEQHVTDEDAHVHVVGDVAWVDSHIRIRADFGVMGRVDQSSRATEIWQRTNGGWKMRHFHCSEHEPGGWEGGR